MKKIKVTCKGSKTMPLGELENFQGNLKELRESELAKLISSIKKYGISFPVFVWENKILDGHQRVFALTKMAGDGYYVPEIPVVEIMAKDEAEAAEKLLMINSRFAKITDDGLYEFINDYNVDLSELPEIELPDIDLDRFMDDYINNRDPSQEPPQEPQNNYAEQYGVIVICEDEGHQEQVYNELTEGGHKCRVVNT